MIKNRILKRIEDIINEIHEHADNIGVAIEYDKEMPNVEDASQIMYKCSELKELLDKFITTQKYVEDLEDFIKTKK